MRSQPLIDLSKSAICLKNLLFSFLMVSPGMLGKEHPCSLKSKRSSVGSMEYSAETENWDGPD